LSIKVLDSVTAKGAPEWLLFVSAFSTKWAIYLRVATCGLSLLQLYLLCLFVSVFFTKWAIYLIFYGAWVIHLLVEERRERRGGGVLDPKPVMDRTSLRGNEPGQSAANNHVPFSTITKENKTNHVPFPDPPV
jgi:hypothetical protein